MRLLTKDDVLVRLRQLVARYGSQTAAADVLGVGLTTLSDVLRERDDPPPRLLTALGLRREVRYTEVR